MNVRTHSLLLVCLAATLIQAAWAGAKPKALDPTYKHVAYGPRAQQKLNFWKVDSEKPTPLLVHIHGGGWLGGKKTETIAPHVLTAGHSYCSIDYRLAGTALLPAAVMDAARAIQFLRTKAKEWNIDTRKIVVTGGSAGAASSLWLAYHADLADPKSADPVLRQSSRVAGAIGAGGQTSLDPFLVEKRIGPAAIRHPMIWKTVGAKNVDELKANWPKFKTLALECSPLTHVSKDDPPVFVKYGKPGPVPVLKGDGIHHAGFGLMLKEKCDALGLECTVEIAGGAKPPFTSSQFLERIFAK
ncbi:alpha/beta hydrolase [bacterium]|nr:alpha/beta hydrolase [bacterium]